MDILQDNRGAKITTPLGADALVLQEFHFDEYLDSDFEGYAQVLSTDSNVDARALLGKPATIELETTGAPRYFNAVIADFKSQGAMGRYTLYHIRLVPWTHLLTLGQDCRVFIDNTAMEIIEEVVKLHGGGDLDKTAISETYRTREMCVQYNESPAAFIRRLMLQEGIISYFSYTDSAHKLTLADSNENFDPIDGYAEIKYFPEEAQRRADGEHIYGWVWQNSVSTGHHATLDYDFKIPRKDMYVTSKAPDGHAEDGREVFSWPGQYIEPKDGDRYNRIRREAQQAKRESYVGRSNVRGMTVGRTFNLAGHPRPEVNIPYLVKSVSHHFRASNYESVKGAGGGAAYYENSFVCVDPKRLYREDARNLQPRILGPQTATVVGKDGEEIDTDEFGRIRVRFHWDRHSETFDECSAWVRVVQKYAGSAWGGQYIPRIGQEVLVEFLDGNPDTPIVTGAVYNGDNKPPFSLPDNKTQSGVRSKSTKDASGSNELRLEDKAGEEIFFIHAQKDHTSRVLNNRTARIDSHDVYSVGGNRSVEVAQNQKHEIGGSLNVSVGGTGVGALGLVGSVGGLAANTAGLLSKAGSIGGATVGGFAATLGSSALGFLNVSGLKGRKGVVGGKNPIEDGGKALTGSGTGLGESASGLFPMPGVMNTVVGAFKSDTIGIGSVEQVGIAKVTNVGAARMSAIGLEDHTTVGKKQTTQVGEVKKIVVGKEFFTEVGKVKKIVVGDEFVIEVGKSRLIMRKNGEVVINGTKFNFTASGAVQINGKVVDLNKP